MSWSDILDFLKGDAPDFNVGEWFLEVVNHVFFGFFGKIINDIFDFTINQMFTLLFQYTSLHSIRENIFNYNSVLTFIQVISGTFLIFLVALEAFERQTSGFVGQKDNSMMNVIGRTLVAGTLLYFLPVTFMNILMYINHALINQFKILVQYDATSAKNVMANFMPADYASSIVLLGGLVVVVAFIVLAFHAGIRYIELIVCILFSPIVAVLFVRNGQYLSTWLREACAIIFTQSVHVLLFLISIKFIVNDQLGLNNLLNGELQSGFIKFITFIGIIIVAIRGPRILRQYLFASGVSGGVMGVVGTGGRSAFNAVVLRKMLLRK